MCLNITNIDQEFQRQAGKCLTLSQQELVVQQRDLQLYSHYCHSSVYYLAPIKPSAVQLHRHFLLVKDTRGLLDKINCGNKDTAKRMPLLASPAKQFKPLF